MTTTRFSPSFLDFGNVNLGQSSSETLTIVNEGSSPVTLTAPGSGYTMSPSTLTVAADSSGSVTVTFSPAAAQAYPDSITDGTTGGGCALSGTGVGIAFTPAAVDLGCVGVNDTATQQLTINTYGTAAVPVTWPATTFYTVAPAPASLPPGALAVTLTFIPTAVSTYPDAIVAGGVTLGITGAGVSITFNPPSVDFGDVALPGSPTQVVTISNSTASPVDIPALTGAFTMPAVTVPPKAGGADGSIPVTVTFNPTAAQSYSGQIAAPSGETCALGGSGDDATPYEPKGTNKSLLFNVPDYADGVFALSRSADVVQPGLSSFIRLGNFDYKTEPPLAQALLAMIHQVGPPGDPTRGTNLQLNVDGTDAYPAPLQTATSPSLPNAWPWDPTADDFTTVPPLQPRGTLKQLPQDAGNQDVFWLDDVCIRDLDVDATIASTDLVGHGLTMAQRQAESARLYSRGGWRDHTDGNRITTTYGDKVEVIRGNYKMIILGRQDGAGDAMGWDASGGNIMDFASGQAVGATFAQWVPDYTFTTPADPTAGTPAVKQTGVWLVATLSENSYTYVRSSGTSRSEQWGDLIEQYTGSENPPLGAPPVGQVGTYPGATAPADGTSFPQMAGATDAVSGTAGHSPVQRLNDIQYDLPQVLNTQPTSDADRNVLRNTPGFSYDNAGQNRSNPHLISRTWARQMDTTQGSEKLPIPVMNQWTYATTSNSYAYGGAPGTGTSYSCLGDADNQLDTVTQYLGAKTVISNTYGTGHGSSYTAWLGTADHDYENINQFTVAWENSTINMAKVSTTTLNLSPFTVNVNLGLDLLDLNVSLSHEVFDLALLTTNVRAGSWSEYTMKSTQYSGLLNAMAGVIKMVSPSCFIGVSPAVPPDPSVAAQALKDAKTAADAAKVAKGAATTAEKAATVAEKAATAAEKTATTAEKAATDAEKVATDAESAATTPAETAAAGTARTAATTARGAATTARGAATTARGAATTARGAATTARGAATAKVTAAVRAVNAIP